MRKISRAWSIFYHENDVGATIATATVPMFALEYTSAPLGHTVLEAGTCFSATGSETIY